MISPTADALAKGAGARSATRVYMCLICGFIYDEAYGLPEEGIAPGTRWEDIPETWQCPDCGVGKADFEMVEV
jgi:rubredoxin